MFSRTQFAHTLHTFLIFALLGAVVLGLLADVSPAHAAPNPPFYQFTDLVGPVTCNRAEISSMMRHRWNIPVGANTDIHITLDGVTTFASTYHWTSSFDNYVGGSFTGFDPVAGVAVGQPYTFERRLTLTVPGVGVASVMTYRVVCSGADTVISASVSNQLGGETSGEAFGGPALPEKRDLVLIGADTPVYDRPGGKLLATGQVLAACQTVYLIDTSEDGAWGQIFVMGGWIPLSTTTDVAESYGQPGGQPTLPRCVGK